MNSRTLLSAAVVLTTLSFGAPALADEPVPTTIVTSDVPPPPPLCEARERPCGFPRLTVAVEGGGSIWNEEGPFSTSTGLGASTTGGGSWGLRVGAEFSRWFAVDAHYIGMANMAQQQYSPSGAIHLYTNAAMAEMRFTLPIPFVQPYLFFGPGIYSTSIAGNDKARAGSPFYNSTEFGIPIGVGLNVPITNRVSLGGELTYHRLFGESLAADDEVGGGDLTTFNAVLRFRI